MSPEYDLVWTANGTEMTDFWSRTGSISFVRNKGYYVRDIIRGKRYVGMIKGSALFKLKHCLTSILFGSFNRVQHIPAAFSSQSDVPLTKWSRCSLQRGTHPDHNFVLATENLEQERRLQGKLLYRLWEPCA